MTDTKRKVTAEDLVATHERIVGEPVALRRALVRMINEALAAARAEGRTSSLDVEQPCKRCGGLGRRCYGSTATWRHGVGGQVLTMDVCDCCWGTGDSQKQGANLRAMENEIRTLRLAAARAESEGHDLCELHGEAMWACTKCVANAEDHSACLRGEALEKVRRYAKDFAGYFGSPRRPPECAEDDMANRAADALSLLPRTEGEGGER